MLAFTMLILCGAGIALGIYTLVAIARLITDKDTPDYP